MKLFAMPWPVAALVLLQPFAHGTTPSAAAAVGTDFHCPATLAQMPVANDIPPGWVVHGTPRELRLQSAAFYDGDPVGLGSLAPDSTQRDGRIEISTWRFGAADSTQVWIGCRYRDATAVVARPLPAGLHQCITILRLTTLGDPAGQVSVRCR
jgi:hypothetical protein